MDWYRWWHGTYTDPKFQMVANDCDISLACVLGIWSAMLEQASSSDPRGSFKFDPEVMTFHLGIDCVTPCNAMKRRGLLHETGEMLHVVNWEKRQPKRERDDNSTDRVRSWRESKKNDVTPCNAMQHHETPRGDKSRGDKSKEETTLSCKQDDALTSSHEVIDFLNSKTGCHYRKTGTTQKFVLARLKDGYSVQDMKTVIAKKCREWINDPAMVSYLRPKTLFNATNFENYHGQCVEVPND